MNALQTFMRDCNRQTRAINQEAVTINGSKYFGTFGDPQLMPVMTRNGSEDHIVQPFISSADQYASKPLSHQNLTRQKTNVVYFVQMVDAKDPVAYTFILVDREL
jgi:hypothetical protein